MLTDFKMFIMRGHVLDLAVAVIIGVAFQQVISVFTDGIVMQIVAAIAGEPQFSSIVINFGESELFIGLFINAIMNFLIVAAVLFLIVKSYEELQARRARGDTMDEPAPDAQLMVLMEIRDQLRDRA